MVRYLLESIVALILYLWLDVLTNVKHVESTCVSSSICLRPFLNQRTPRRITSVFVVVFWVFLR